MEAEKNEVGKILSLGRVGVEQVGEERRSRRLRRRPHSVPTGARAGG